MAATERAKALLAEPRICVLATTGPGDTPHAMPMWYLYQNDELLLQMAPGSQKHKNVERTGKATVVVDQREPPYYAVMVKGDADVLPDTSAAQRLAMATRYLGAERGKRYIDSYGGDDVVTIRVRPTRWVEYQGRS